MTLWITTLLLFVALTALPLWWGRNAVRRPGPAIIACSFFASFLSTNTFLGQAGFGYRAGLTWMLGAAVFLACGAISWFVVAGPLVRDARRVLGVNRAPDDLTLPLYLREKYESPALGFLAAGVVFLASIVYIAAVYKGAGHALAGILGLPYEVSVLAIFAIVAAYSVWGMVRAILLTDLAQTMALVAGSLALFAMVSWRTDWGTLAASAGTAEGLLTWGARVSPVWAFGVAFSVGLKLILAPRLLVRFLLFAHSTPRELRKAGWIALALMGVTFPLLYSLGVLAHGVIPPQAAAGYIANTDDVVPYLVLEVCPPAVAALVLAGLVCAALSSVDSSVHVAGAALVIDIASARGDWPAARRRRWQRAAMFVSAFLPALVALDPPAGVVPLVAASGAIIGSTLAGPVLLGLVPRFATRGGALAGLCGGGFVAAAWAFGGGAWLGAGDIHSVFIGCTAGVLSQLLFSCHSVLGSVLFGTKKIEPNSLSAKNTPRNMF